LTLVGRGASHQGQLPSHWSNHQAPGGTRSPACWSTRSASTHTAAAAGTSCRRRRLPLPR